METVIRLNNAVNEFAWGSFGLALIVGAGIICTLATGFFQITKIGHWFKNTFGIINGRGRIINDAGALSQRRTFWTTNILWAIGAVLMIAMAAILIGGFRRLAAISEVIMPYLCAAYVIGCLLVVTVNIARFPEAFASIFRFAFRTRAVAGGTAGTALAMTINTIQHGCKRGVFSNEAGMGSSVMIHVTSCNREPVHQGLWGIAEVFVDTVVICTFTALVILCSGFIDLRTGVAHDIVNDATLVTEVFGASLGKPGEWFIVIIITMFAFTSVLGWSYYGSKVTEYLFGVVASKIYRVVFLLLIVAGAVMESSLAWDISDTFNGLMMIPNLIGVLSQIPLIIRLTKNYTDRKIKGKDIEPVLSYNSDIQAEALRAIQKGAD